MADAGHRNQTSIAKALEPRIQRDRKLLQDLQARFDARRKEIFTKADAEQLSEAVGQEQKLFDETLGGRKRPGAPDLVGPAARRAIRDKLVKRVPAAAKITRLNAEHIAQLYGVLFHHGGATFDPDIVFNPDALLDVSLEPLNFQQFEAPYDFSEVPQPTDPDLDFDGSYAVHQWGIFGNDIEFSLSQSSFLGDSKNKLAFAVASVGLNCTLPASGRLAVTLLIRSLSSDIHFEMVERTGPSDGLVELENTLFVRVVGAGGTAGHLEATTIFDESRRFKGDDISGALAVIPQGKQFIVTFTTDATFAQNEAVTITAATFLRAFSHAFLIRNRISATVNWHLEKVFVTVV